MPRFAHLAQRLFNTPLAIRPEKAEIIMAALAERLGVSRLYRPNGEMVALGPDASVFGDMWGSEDDDRSRGYDLVEGVAVIAVEGTLVQKLGTLRPYSGMTGYDSIRQNFLTARADPKVRGIALDIDSPGGEVRGLFDLVDEIFAGRGDKPIWAILSEMACSAAYAIASAADRITVPRTGYVGSIGVIWMHVDWSAALTEAGIKVTYLTYGARKADGNETEPLKGAAKAGFQADIDQIGELFVETVARNRGISADAVRATEADYFQGAEGVALGLADAVMAPDAAFRALLDSLS